MTEELFVDVTKPPPSWGMKTSFGRGGRAEVGGQGREGHHSTRVVRRTPEVSQGERERRREVRGSWGEEWRPPAEEDGEWKEVKGKKNSKEEVRKVGEGGGWEAAVGRGHEGGERRSNKEEQRGEDGRGGREPGEAQWPSLTSPGGQRTQQGRRGSNASQDGDRGERKRRGRRSPRYTPSPRMSPQLHVSPPQASPPLAPPSPLPSSPTLVLRTVMDIEEEMRRTEEQQVRRKIAQAEAEVGVQAEVRLPFPALPPSLRCSPSCRPPGPLYRDSYRRPVREEGAR